MWFLLCLSYVSVIFQFCFVSLAVASGLYYLAELVEEFVSTAAKIVKTLILITIGIYVGFLLFEDFPLLMTVCGLVAQIAHLYMMKTFPYFILSSPAFILMVTFLIINHYLAFTYFSSHYYPFIEVMAYFTLCLWLVPFAFFVSLSANDLVLPTTSPMDRPKFSQVDNDAFSNYIKTKGKRLGLLAFLNGAKDMLLPQRTKKVF
ncbi:hypothetical protein Ocin01_00456 [Orchesella cincta]|uniref:Protein TEX261 n=1 Tax=Orchesella cincta TaxID=48709 RepID=A0A1D2NLQ5_ORCCI|nr:hypothetical protein Ocin01_00456 [Orchesella cincta]